jgi:UDP-N-acetylglucosamine 2-epimerase
MACDAVVGNSSSGVIEAPAAGTPSVNVGLRQDGRLKPPSVIDCPLESAAIADAIRRAAAPGFKTAAQSQPPPFGDGRAGQRIVEILEGTDLAGLARKPFIDRV